MSMYILLDEKSDVSSDKVIDEIEKRTKNLDCKVTASSPVSYTHLDVYKRQG